MKKPRSRAGHPCERHQERGTGYLQVREEAEPLLLLLLSEGKPVVELVTGDAETLTQRFYGSASTESLREEPEDEEEAIAGIGDDEIWDDGVGRAAARVGKAEDGDIVLDTPAIVGRRGSGSFLWSRSLCRPPVPAGKKAMEAANRTQKISFVK